MSKSAYKQLGMPLSEEIDNNDGWKSQEDSELLRSAAAGNRQAFKVLYLRHFSRLRQFATRLTRRPDMVEEILNDTFFTVWQKAGSYKSESSVSTWIFGVCYKKCLKALERSERWRSRHTHSDDHEQLLVDPTRPEIEASRVQLQQHLQEQLSSLPPEQRMVFELTYFLGCSYPEIAKVANCPVNTVKTRMFHARKKLRETLKPHTNDI